MRSISALWVLHGIPQLRWMRSASVPVAKVYIMSCAVHTKAIILIFEWTVWMDYSCHPIKMGSLEFGQFTFRCSGSHTWKHSRRFACVLISRLPLLVVIKAKVKCSEQTGRRVSVSWFSIRETTANRKTWRKKRKKSRINCYVCWHICLDGGVAINTRQM